MVKKRIAVQLALVLLLLGMVAVWWAGSVLVSPARVEIPTVPLGAKSVEFFSKSGSVIKGWYYSTEGAVASAVLMHGVRGNRTDLSGRVPLFQELGFSVLTFDFQSHGDSEGDAITFGARESLDAIAAVDYVRKQQPNNPVLTLGVSLGGASALLAGEELNADFLVVESVYSNINQAVENRLNMRVPLSGYLAPLLLLQLRPRLGIDAGDLSPLKSAESVTIPTLVLSGSDDEHALVWETKAIYKALSGHKRLHIFEGAVHQNLERFDPVAYREVLIQFVCSVIPAQKCSYSAAVEDQASLVILTPPNKSMQSEN